MKRPTGSREVTAQRILAAALPEMKRLSAELHGGQDAPSTMEYERHKAPGSPDRQMIQKYFGEWSVWCVACEMKFSGRVKDAWHEEKRDALLTLAVVEMKRLAQELHGGQYAPSQAEYEAFAAEDAPTRTFLHKRFPGGWDMFCEHCELTPAPYVYYYHMAKKRQEEWDALQRNGAPTVVAVGKERDKMRREGSQGLQCLDTPRVDTWRSTKDGKIYQGLAWAVI